MKTSCGRHCDHSKSSYQKCFFMKITLIFLSDLVGGTMYLAKKDRKNTKSSGRIYMPQEWMIGLTWVHVWKKENTINQKAEFWVLEACVSHFPPHILSWPEREKKQCPLRTFFLVRNEASHHIAAECYLLKEIGHVYQSQTDVFMSDYLNATPHVQLVWHSRRKI